ncbi:MAG: VTT domain-containing protein [Legionellaceae bacterium]|nr:VTT domain-containing protein [Legionellaceae bacterium]
MNLAEVFDWVQIFLAHHVILAPILYVVFHIIFAVCIIPCSPMAVIAGMLWGKGLGLGISILAAFLSSCTTFWLARIFFRKRVYNFLSKRYKKTDWFLEQTKKQGWKFVATVQLNPAAPGSTLGYIFGLTDISFVVYAFFLLLFMMPLQFILVLCGDSMPILLAGRTPWVLLGIMLLVILYLLNGVRRESKT